ncbi:MAG: ABC transporter substrate-binding protein [Bacillota bacterium]|nr:ABC transporter substrate-binding protein [Bacillota bacterium]
MKKWIALLLAFAMVFCLFACGGGEEDPAAGDGGEAEGASSVIVGIQQDFDSLDPYIAQASGTEEIMLNVFAGLLSFSPEGEMTPGLAESWEISEDGLIYTFHLREGVTFHDGSDFTAADVKYSLDRLCGKDPDEPEVTKATFADVITEVVVVDDYTVEMHINANDASFLAYMYVGMMPEGSGPDQATHPIGAGPYMFVDYTPGMGMNLTKFENYYEEGLPKIDEVEVKIFADMSTAVLALSNGEYDYMTVTYDILEQVPADSYVIEQYGSNTIQLLGLNNSFEPFQDVRVRQAINYAINKDDIISIVAPGSEKVGSNFSPVMGFWYEDLSDYYTYDPEQAQALLAEAGYSDLTFTCRVASEYDQNVDAATIIKDQLAQVGVTMELDIIDWNTWLEEVYTNFSHEATVIGFTGKLDPDPVLKRFMQGYGRNFINFDNDRYTEIIETARLTNDVDERAALYKEAQTILAQEAASVFIQDVTNYVAVNAELQGFVSYPFTFIDMRNWEWAE